VLGLHHPSRHDVPGLLGAHHRARPEAAAVLGPIGIDRGPLPVTVLGDQKDLRAVGSRVHGHDLVAFPQSDSTDTPADPAHDPHPGLGEADGHPVPGDQDQLLTSSRRCLGPCRLVPIPLKVEILRLAGLPTFEELVRLRVQHLGVGIGLCIFADDRLAGREDHADQFVALLEDQGIEAAGSQVRVGLQGRPLDHALAGGGHDIAAFLRVPARNHGGDLLALGQAQKVDHGGPSGAPAELGDLVDLQLEDPSLVREEEQRPVGAGHEEVLQEVLLLEVRPRDAPSPAPLNPVGVEGHALDVAGMRKGDHHLLVGDQVLDVEVPSHEGLDLRPAVIAETSLDVQQLGADHAVQLLPAGQQALEVLDGGQQDSLLLLELLALQAGQALQPHVEDGLGLDLGESEALHQPGPSAVGIAGGPDQGNDLVDVVQGLQQARDDVLALAGLLQLVTGAPGDHVATVVDEVPQDLLECQDARNAVHQGQQDHPEVGLQVGVLVELVHHDVRNGVVAQLDHDAHAFAVGLVAQVRDPLDPLLLHGVSDALDQAGLVDLVGDLGDDDGSLVAPDLLDFHDGPGRDTAPTRRVGVADPVLPEDPGSRGEVRAGDVRHQPFEREILILHQGKGAVDDLPQVVRRNLGRHADGDPVRAVDQQVREHARKDRGLLRGAVEIRPPVDRVLVQVSQHVHGRASQAGLGVAHVGRRVTIDRPEVAMALHQRISKVEVLRHAHHGIVDRRVTVRVIARQHVAHRGRRLPERLVRGDALLVHGVEDAAMHGFQAVSHIRQGPGDDDAHRVIDVGLLHLVFDGPGHDAAQIFVGHGFSSICQGGANREPRCPGSSRPGHTG